ncbi:MAG: tetratricopeptide repeat protein [Chloroflexota bacterium]
MDSSGRTDRGLTTTLPPRLSSFIGREREIQDVVDLVGVHRLVTLAGAPGVGKTRLALRVATVLQGQFRDGVAFVELAGLGDPSLVPSQVATELGIQERGNQSIRATLAEVLQGRDLLLVVDNCEHLIDACAELVGHLLGACPTLHMLATSREALRCEGELLWRVPSLSTPPADPTSTVGGGPAELDGYEAVQLFVARARAARPQFDLSSHTAPVVARICARLDGIPLAIELAAARVPHLSLAQIASRLDDCFQLLTGGVRTALPRQQTLEATVEWSYRLLPPAEQALLRRLSVFAGGWTLEAAEATAPDPTRRRVESGAATMTVPGHTPTPFELLSRLVDKSLVEVEDAATDRPRYRCLEMIRQYAFDRLSEAGETDDARRRHAEYFVQLAEDAEDQLWRADHVAWFERLELERDNLRAAIQASQSDPRLRLLGARAVAALWWFWLIRGYFTDGLHSIGHAIDGVEVDARAPGASRVYSRALVGAGMLAIHGNELGQATDFLDRSLDIATRGGEESCIAWALACQGRLARALGEYERGIRVLERSLARFRALEDRRGIALTLHLLGSVAWGHGDLDRAARFQEECLRVFGQEDERFGAVVALEFMARVAYGQGRIEEALAVAEEHLALCRELRYRWGIGFSLVTLGMVAQHRGQVERAVTLYQESLAVRQEMGDREGIAECCERLASIASVRGQPALSARLFGAAEALRDRIGAPVPAAGRSDYERDVSATRASLDAEAFVAEWSRGRVAGTASAVELASSLPAEAQVREQEADSLGDRPCPGTDVSSELRADSRSGPAAGTLTRREDEVAALTAAGLSNQQIADRLVVSKRTVDAHMASILAKLGFANRAQVAVWAVHKGSYMSPGHSGRAPTA